MNRQERTAPERRQSVLDIGDDHLLVLQRDELGVESVLRLALTRDVGG